MSCDTVGGGVGGAIGGGVEGGRTGIQCWQVPVCSQQQSKDEWYMFMWWAGHDGLTCSCGGWNMMGTTVVSRNCCVPDVCCLRVCMFVKTIFVMSSGREISISFPVCHVSLPPSPPPPSPPFVCLTVADTDGMVKVLSDSKTDRILGVHIIGSVSYCRM